MLIIYIIIILTEPTHDSCFIYHHAHTIQKIPSSCGILSCMPTPVQQFGKGKRNAEVSSQLMKLYCLSPNWAASHAAGHSSFTAEQCSGHIEDGGNGEDTVPHGLR